MSSRSLTPLVLTLSISPWENSVLSTSTSISSAQKTNEYRFIFLSRASPNVRCCACVGVYGVKPDEGCDWDTDLCQTLSGQSPCGSPGCPYGPGPGLHESAAGIAASAGASVPSPRSPAGADSSGPPLQVST